MILKRLTEGQAVVISCSPWQAHGGLTGLHLYHRGVQSQTTLVSVTEAGEVTVATDHRARLVLRGDLSSMKVNVTISRLELSDTGLYMWDLSYRDTNSSDQMILCAQKTFVLVEVAGIWLHHLTVQDSSLLRFNCCLCCREAVPLLSWLRPSTLDHLHLSRASSADPHLAGHPEMCE